MMRTTGIGFASWTGGRKGGGRNPGRASCSSQCQAASLLLVLIYSQTHGSRDHSGVNTSCSWVTTHEIAVELAPYFDLAPVQTIQAIHVQDAR